MIAIGAQIGTGKIGATPTSPNVTPGAANLATLSFSALLEQAQPLLGDPADAGASTSQGSILGNQGSISRATKRDSKASDSKASDSKTSDAKTNDWQGRGNVPEQTAVASSVVQDTAIPPVVVQPTAAPILPWNAEVKDFTLDVPAAPQTSSSGAVPNDSTAGSKVTSAPASAPDSSNARDTTLGSTSLPTFAKDAAPSPDLEIPSAPSQHMGDAVEAASVKKTLADIAAPNSKAQPISAPALPQIHGASHGSSESTGSESTASANKAQAAIKSEIEQAIVPPAVASPALVAPPAESGKVDAGSSLGTKAKLQSDKLKISASQENGAPGKSVEVSGDIKTQTHKDDSSSSGSLQTAANQDSGNAPATAADSAPSFAVAGIQLASAGGDAKAGNITTPHSAGDPQAAQLDQKSTGVAESQAQAESVAASPASQIHSAKLVQSIGEAELRLGVRAGEFGSVDIRTLMVRNQFTAEISVERGELGRIMAAELPNLQNRLTEQRVPVANITLQNHAGSSSTPSEQQRPRDRPEAYATNPVGAKQAGPLAALAASEGIASASRLDIHM